MTEQERFQAMLRDHLAPALRTLGLRGSGRRFVLPDEGEWRLVGIQGSRWSTATSVGFTANLVVADKGEWARYRAEQPGVASEPSAIARDRVGRMVRLGHLLPVGQDHWWELTSGVRPDVLAAEVADAIARYGLPWLGGEIPREPGV